MFSVFLSSRRSTRKGLGGLKKAVETLAYGPCSHSISCFPKLPLVFLLLDRNNNHTGELTHMPKYQNLSTCTYQSEVDKGELTAIAI